MSIAIRLARTVTGAVAVIAIAACSSAELKPTETETFAPKIFADGTKTFTYTLEDHGRPETRTYIQLQDQRLEDIQNQGETPEPPEEQRRARAEWRFYRLLEVKLEQTAFCRKGYIELEADIGIDKSMLRGECREAATAEDREHFGDSSQMR